MDEWSGASKRKEEEEESVFSVAEVIGTLCQIRLSHLLVIGGCCCCSFEHAREQEETPLLLLLFFLFLSPLHCFLSCNNVTALSVSKD